MKKIILNVWFKLHKLIGEYYWLPKIKQQHSLFKVMKYFKEKSNSTGVGYGDIFFLYQEIKKRKPKTILEFGTGASTAYIALAIKELKEEDNLYDPKFFSLENNEKWFKHQLEIFPKDLKEFDNRMIPTKETYKRLDKNKYVWDRSLIT